VERGGKKGKKEERRETFLKKHLLFISYCRTEEEGTGAVSRKIKGGERKEKETKRRLGYHIHPYNYSPGLNPWTEKGGEGGSEKVKERRRGGRGKKKEERGG